MLKLLLNLFLIMKLSSCQRRITNGSSVDSRADTSFMVYIVAAKTTDSAPGWLCGGSIIHPSLVLTSASCLKIGTQQMYVIAGYRKYVMTARIDQDPCTRHMKKRIVSFCLHWYYAYDEYRNTTEERNYRWLKFDIGIAKTDTPIDFYDTNYLKYCSYLPSSIRTNYNSKYEQPGFSVVIYGWGHAVHYRPNGDLTDYNEDYLRYASSVILPRNNCMKLFKGVYLLHRIRHNFMCADGKGKFDARGKYLVREKPTMSICNGRRSGGNDTEIDSKNRTSCFESNSNDTSLNNDTFDASNITATRRNGICQNDHGGPMVRWIGGRPFVIGVASAFRVNKKMECVGPYLYTSVLCTSQFIHCILQQQNTVKSRRIASNCENPGNGYKIEETEVEWSDEDL